MNCIIFVLFQIPVLDTYYLGFTLVTSGYVQHLPCSKEVRFPFDIQMVLFTWSKAFGYASLYAIPCTVMFCFLNVR